MASAPGGIGAPVGHAGGGAGLNPQIGYVTGHLISYNPVPAGTVSADHRIAVNAGRGKRRHGLIGRNVLR